MNKTIQENRTSVVETDKQDKKVDSKNESFFLKRLWNNYIKRLNKVTNGKPQCCK